MGTHQGKAFWLEALAAAEDRGARYRPVALALMAAILILLAMVMSGGHAALAAKGCGQRVKIDVHFLKTKYVYSASQKKVSKLAGAPAWGLYVTSMKYSGQSVVRGECVKVNLDVYVNSKIYVAKELKKNKCRFDLVLAHEKTHRADDRKSLRNMLNKRNTLINKLSIDTEQRVVLYKSLEDSLKTAAQQKVAHQINTLGSKVDTAAEETMAGIGAAAQSHIADLLELHGKNMQSTQEIQRRKQLADDAFARRFAQVMDAHEKSDYAG